jgi:hypothetical protein
MKSGGQVGWSSEIGWVLLMVLVVGLVAITVTLVVTWRKRRGLVDSVKYLLDRLQVTENDLCREREELLVLKEYLRRKGILDDEDLAMLRRELIDIPRQREAEKEELFKEALGEGDQDRIIKNTPDTIH